MNDIIIAQTFRYYKAQMLAARLCGGMEIL
jgi:hypothetical protein